MRQADRTPGVSGRVSAGLLVVVVVVLAAGGIAWRGIAVRGRTMTTLAAETRELNTPTVSVTSPKAGSPEEALVLPGSLQAIADAPIYARTNGYVKRRYVDIGSRVSAGQVLAELDAPELEQQLQQARADQATADANLRLAQLTADRYRELMKADSVTQQDADNAAGTLEARKSAAESAHHNVRRLEQLQAFTRIVSPIAGVVTVRNTDVGALIDPGASGGAARELFHIASTGRLRVSVSVPERFSRVAEPGLEADMTLAEFPGRRFRAKLVRTAEAIDVVSRTLLVELEVDNPKSELLPGAFVQVHFKLPTAASTLVLPVNALIFRADGVRVGVLKADSTIALVPVTIGRDFGTEVEIVAGLTADAKVVVSPPDSLVAGQTVRVLKAGADAPKTAADVPKARGDAPKDQSR
jgi:RND family efflux transporter MFP subunit